MVIYNPVENCEEFLKLGEQAKQRMMDLILKEGIHVEESFEHAIFQNFSYSKTTTFGTNKKSVENTKHVIQVPKFSDDSAMEQAFKLAHVLGHYFSEKNSGRIKKQVIKSNYAWTIFYSQKIAWKEALTILEKEGILSKLKYNTINYSAYVSFLRLMSNSLNGFRREFVSFFPRVFLKLFRLYVGVYFLLGTAWVFQKNGVPLPFSFELQSNEFQTLVWGFFNIMLMTKIGYILLFKFPLKNKINEMRI